MLDSGWMLGMPISHCLPSTASFSCGWARLLARPPLNPAPTSGRVGLRDLRPGVPLVKEPTLHPRVMVNGCGCMSPIRFGRHFLVLGPWLEMATRQHFPIDHPSGHREFLPRCFSALPMSMLPLTTVTPPVRGNSSTAQWQWAPK